MVSGVTNSLQQQPAASKQKQLKKPRKSKKQQQAEALAAANAGGLPDQLNMQAWDFLVLSLLPSMTSIKR